METVKQYQLDNLWRVTFTPENFDEDNHPYTVQFSVEHLNGNRFEHEFNGQIKRTGCWDIGFNEPLLLHFCGTEDTKLFGLMFIDANAILNPDD